MELRDYQKDCIDTIETQPPGAYLVQMATGLGKTVTFANLPRHGERMLILSHREELVEQPRKYFPFPCTYGVERGTQRSSGEEVVSASVQSLVRRLDRFSPDEFGIIICDEAHHAAAGTYRKIFDYFHPEKLIGFTATPNRGDKVRLDDVFQKIIFQRDLRWGIQNGSGVVPVAGRGYAMSERWEFPWEQEAQRGADMPDGLKLADQMAYAALRSIYHDFHEKRMDRGQASREKQLLRRSWEKAKEAEAFSDKLTAHHVRLIRATERVVCACRKDPTPENALRLCDAIDGLDGMAN